MFFPGRFGIYRLMASCRLLSLLKPWAMVLQILEELPQGLQGQLGTALLKPDHQSGLSSG